VARRSRGAELELPDCWTWCQECAMGCVDGPRCWVYTGMLNLGRVGIVVGIGMGGQEQRQHVTANH